MSSRRRSSGARERAAVVGGKAVHQHTFFERLDALTRRAEVKDPERPALALLWVVVVLMGLGLIVQASHAASVCDPATFRSELVSQLFFRFAGICALVLSARIGPAGLRPYVPFLTVLCLVLLVLVYVPPLGAPVNGSHRWLRMAGLSFQPSELARIVLILWVADRCVRLGPRVRDMRRGVLPMLGLAFVFFALILLETDLGAAMLLLICALCTLWVGGARPVHVAGTLVTVGGGALLMMCALIPYIRARVEMFLGRTDNGQVQSALDAMASGGLFGQGMTHGLYRRLGVPYLESDFVLAQIGEEFGLVGVGLVIGLLLAFTWFALQVVVSIRDRYGALCAFGLLVSTSLGAMLHVQVVAGLAPPKGMTLPFVSDGGTSLLVSSLAVGLALGAARATARPGVGRSDVGALASKPVPSHR